MKKSYGSFNAKVLYAEPGYFTSQERVGFKAPNGEAVVSHRELFATKKMARYRLAAR